MKRLAPPLLFLAALMTACSGGQSSSDAADASDGPTNLARSGSDAVAAQCGLFDDVFGDAAWDESVTDTGSEPRLSVASVASERTSERAAFRIQRSRGDEDAELVGVISRRFGAAAPDAVDGTNVIETTIDAIRVASSSEGDEDRRSVDAAVIDGLRGATVRTTMQEDGTSVTELCLVTWVDDEDKVLRERVLEPIALALPGLPSGSVGAGGAWSFTLDEHRTDWGSQGGGVQWELDRFDGSAYVATWSMEFDATVDDAATVDDPSETRLEGQGRVAARLDQALPVSSIYEVTVTTTSQNEDTTAAMPAEVEVRRVEVLSA